MYTMLLCIVLIVLKSALDVCCYSSDHHSVEVDYYFDNVNISPPKPGWIDPFDMVGVGETLQTSDTSLMTQNDVENHKLKRRIESCQIHLRKFVNLFLSSIDLKDSDTSFDSVSFVKMEFLIKGEDLNTLKHFGQHGNAGEEIENVSRIFSKIFAQNQSKKEFKFEASFVLDTLKRSLLTILRSPEWVVVSSVSCMLILTLWIVLIKRSYRLALFTIFLTIFFGGFGFNWMRMYEEREAETFSILVNYGGGVPPYHCSGKTLVWYENIYYKLFGIDCYEFYKARDVRPLVKISPTDVLVETVSSMIFNPAAKIGSAYGNFVKHVNDSVPWWLKPVAVPLSFIIPLIFTIVLLIFFFNYQMSVSVTGFYLTPGSCVSQNKGNNKYIEEISLTKKELQDVNTVKTLSKSDTPMYVVCNYLGLKKLCSDTEISKKDLNKDSEIISNKISNSEDSNENNIKSISENTVVEEVSKLIDCKLRTKSAYSAACESSHSNICKGDNERLYPDLASCNENQPLINDKEKEHIGEKNK